MLIIGVIGSILCILAPALVWVAYDRMDDAIYTAGIVSLILGEILVWVYLTWFLWGGKHESSSNNQKRKQEIRGAQERRETYQSGKRAAVSSMNSRSVLTVATSGAKKSVLGDFTEDCSRIFLDIDSS